MRLLFGRCVLMLVVATLAGCATYQAKPLSQQPALLADTAALRAAVDANPHVAQRRFDPADGLDAAELATAAVLTSPTLRAARAQHGVARAQLYAAGLLPDPTFSASVDFPPSGSSEVIGYLFGLVTDAAAKLITRGARKQAADQTLRQVDLNLLWMEWQTAQQARNLYVSLVFLHRKIDVAQTMLALYRKRYQRSARALARGDLTVDVTGLDLTALLDASSQLNQLRQMQVQKAQDLNALLGIAADAELKLAQPQAYTSFAAKLARERAADVIQRRPDLLALRAGYASQEANVRAAVLGQFPALSLGVNRQRDIGGTKLVGISVDVGLPLFSGNRGAIAIARATRAQLRAEYQARLDQLPGVVTRLLATQSLLQSQHALLQKYLPVLQAMVSNIRRAYARGDIDALTTLNLEQTLLNKRLEALDVSEQLWNTRYALETMLALPDAAPPQ